LPIIGISHPEFPPPLRRVSDQGPGYRVLAANGG
jgi:hypothetical protein